MTMRHNGPTPPPANDLAPAFRRLGAPVAALGLVGLLCLGTPATAFAQDAHPSPTPSAPAAPAVEPTAPPTAAPSASPTATSTPAATPTPTPTPTTPAASAPTAPAASAPIAPTEAPAAPPVEAQRGGFTDLVATTDSVLVASNHSARWSWSALLGNDVNPTGQPILLTGFSSASHGTIDKTAGSSFLYTPTPGYVGKDLITYLIHDVFGNTNSSPGAIVITVAANKAPVASPDSFSVIAGKPFVAPAKALFANDTDAENDPLTTLPAVLIGPDHGSATMNASGDGGFTYTPDPGYTGYDAFFYRVSDGHGGISNVAAVELSVVNKFVTVKPVVSGTPAVGSVLTVKTGVWSPVPANFQYQWFRDGDPIAGATQKSYTPTPDDLGWTLRAMVIGSKTGYPTEQIISGATTAVVLGSFTTTPVPTISGTARVGATLTAKAGTWLPTPEKVSYYWKANGVLIPGVDVSKSTFTPTAAQLGKKIMVTSYVERAGYGAYHLDSEFTAVVAPGVFTAAPAPTITGTAKVGALLTAHAGTWKPTPNLYYQWKRSGTSIPGATAATYRLTSSDLGKTVTVVVTAKKTGWTSLTRTSVATAKTASGTLSATPTPTITGTAKVGSTLTAKAGTWSPSPVTVKYQWKRNGVTITGATAASYTLPSSAAGAKLTVTVTGSKAGYTTVGRTSAATASVAK